MKPVSLNEEEDKKNEDIVHTFKAVKVIGFYLD
jgi:hypothetical protein